MTNSLLTKREALGQLIRFALPIIAGHVGIMLIGTGDMIIAGQYSIEALAAVGLAISVANPIMISLLGFQFAISPLLAQRRGNGGSIDELFWTAIFYSLLIAFVSAGLTYLSIYLLPFFGYDPNITRLISEYLQITSFSAFGLCLYQGVKEFFQSEEKIFAANIVAILAVGVNLLFNYAFVFGKFGVPSLQEAGLAWASLGVRSFMGLTLFALTSKYWKTSFKIDWKFIRELWKVGGPITLSLFFEVMAFCSVTLFVGKFAEIQTAANNIALNLGSLAFMVPMSISAAVAVKVGHAFGERNSHRILTFAQASLFASFCFTALMGIIFYLLPDPILKLYTADLAVLVWAKKLLFLVACFQLFDGAQVTMAGILRGLSVTRPVSISVFIGYWIIGIPLGYYLGFHAGFEAQGFWIGLAIALAIVAIMLGVVLKKKFKERAGIETPL
jgi:multidrug resistance protein, MATE family